MTWKRLMNKLPREAISSAVSSSGGSAFVRFSPREAVRKISAVFDI